MEPRLNHLQEYLAEEFVEEYKEGKMTRRQLLARILGITGGVASAAGLLTALGCAPASQATPTSVPATSAPPTSAPPTTAPPTSVPATSPPATKPAGAAAPAAPTSTPPRSKYSVKADD